MPTKPFRWGTLSRVAECAHMEVGKGVKGKRPDILRRRLHVRRVILGEDKKVSKEEGIGVKYDKGGREENRRDDPKFLTFKPVKIPTVEPLK